MKRFLSVLIFGAAVLLMSCTNTQVIDSTNNDVLENNTTSDDTEMCNLSVRINESDARYIAPDNLTWDITSTSVCAVKKIVMSYKTSAEGNSTSIGEWTCKEEKTAYEVLQAETIELASQYIYSFSIELKNSDDLTLATGTIAFDKLLTSSNGALSFTTEFYSDSETKGSLNVVCSWAATADVGEVQCALLKTDLTEEISYITLETATDSEKGTVSVTYSEKDITPGNYYVCFKFYSKNDTEKVTKTYMDYVCIRSGLTSCAEKELTNFNSYSE